MGTEKGHLPLDEGLIEAIEKHLTICQSPLATADTASEAS